MLANWLNTQIDIFPHRLHDSWLFLGPCNSIFFFSGNCPPQRSLSCPFLNPFHSKQAECRRCTKRTGVNRRQTPQCSRQRCHFVHFYTKKTKPIFSPFFCSVDRRFLSCWFCTFLLFTFFSSRWSHCTFYLFCSCKPFDLWPPRSFVQIFKLFVPCHAL